jgi:hypothetical protein
MPIKLPNLAQNQAIRLIACGSIEGKQKLFRGWLNQKRTLISSYEAGKHTYFLRCATGGFAGHFHLECAAPEAFIVQPKRTASRKDIDAVTEKVLGLPITVRVTCYFLVPIASLVATGIIRTLGRHDSRRGIDETDRRHARSFGIAHTKHWLGT